jgi:hypothetical protein
MKSVLCDDQAPSLRRLGCGLTGAAVGGAAVGRCDGTANWGARLEAWCVGCMYVCWSPNAEGRGTRREGCGVGGLRASPAAPGSNGMFRFPETNWFASYFWPTSLLRATCPTTASLSLSLFRSPCLRRVRGSRLLPPLHSALHRLCHLVRWRLAD